MFRSTNLGACIHVGPYRGPEGLNPGPVSRPLLRSRSHCTLVRRAGQGKSQCLLYDLRNLAADPAYDGIVCEMCRRMWRFARREDDTVLSPYITVSLAPYGPAEAVSVAH